MLFCRAVDGGSFRHYVLRTVAVGALFFAASTTAIPTITFPINSQVPPVARVNTPFMYTFSTSTFSSPSPMTYNLSSGPSWLNLESATRTLSGMPPQSDANTAPVIEITAADDSGFVTMNTTLVISGSPAPTILVPLEEQLQSFGTGSSPNAIVYYVSTPFRFSFSPQTFGGSQLNYYATTLDNTPLPSWILFDGASLSFSGTTPDASSLIQPPQTFGIQLIASDVIGFAGTAIPFDIVIGIHKLDFKNEFQTTNATVGVALNFTGFVGTLNLDDQTADMSNIQNVTANNPSWLKLDPLTFVLSGIPPNGTESFNVTVTASDIFEDVANTTLEVHFPTTIFTDTLGSVNATAGTHFSLNLTSSFVNPGDLTVAVDIYPSNPWLTFDSNSLTLAGDVPLDTPTSDIEVSLNATSNATGFSEMATLMIAIIAAQKTTTSATNIASPTSTPTVSSVPETASRTGLSNGQIAAAVILPILVVAVLLLSVICCGRRREHGLSQPKSPAKSEISRPMAQEDVEEDDRAMNQIVARHKSNPLPAIGHLSFDTVKRHRVKSLGHAHKKSGSVNGSDSRDSRSTSARARSFSATAISDYDSTWRHTQDGAYPRLPPLAVREHRRTRNFSRKTNELEQDEERDSFGRMESDLAPAPLRRLSRSSIQVTPDIVYDSGSVKAQRQTQRQSQRQSGRQSQTNGQNSGPMAYLGKRLTGLGHGSRRSVVPSTSDGHRTSGFGRGSDTEPNSLRRPAQPSRDNSWITIEAADIAEDQRLSTLSALTESTDVLEPDRARTAPHLTIRAVPPSPATMISHLSQSSDSRESRKKVGMSLFFPGSSRAPSRGETRNSTQSEHGRVRERAVAEAIAEKEQSEDSLDRLELSIKQGLRDIEPPSPLLLTPRGSDALGISMTSPRLFVQGIGDRISRRLRNSLTFSDSDSRFHSAVATPDYRQQNSRDEAGEVDGEHYGYSPSKKVYKNSASDEDGDGDDEESFIYDAQAIELPGSRRLHNPSLTDLRKPQRTTETGERVMPGPGRPVSIDEALTAKSETMKLSGIVDFSSHMERGSDADTSHGGIAFL